ncbi:hypothetical protein [Nocardioides sp. W7]|uniref:hypothetical protein n=1 Tax=Nocardioides sp. W7 TaxID=2931390 RepID=UPI001FD556DB|nr:hypothetical protein [Nocardioides sp. W7]
MSSHLTDDEVVALPLHHGRAELLEEIMRSPVLDDRPVRTRPRGRRTWLVPVAAAAAVAALAAGAAWWGGAGPGAGGSAQPAGPVDPTVEAGWTVLDAPGWVASYAYVDSRGGEVIFEKGDASFDVSWQDAASYEEYVEDRRHITEPPADGVPVEVLGRPAQIWAYSARDHTVIREVQNGSWVEVRGSGMDEDAYLDLLGRLRQVDRATFEAALPPDFVDGTERDAEIEELLDGIRAHVDPLLPPGSTRTGFSSEQNDPYQLGADVAGQLACEWITEFRLAVRAGDEARADLAAEAIATTRQWPVLREMAADGEYPQFIWGLADEVAAGRVPRNYTDGLGCEG